MSGGGEIESYTQGATPFHVAAEGGCGANTFAALRAAGCRLDAINHDGQGALEVAVRHGQLRSSKALLDAGADPLLDIYVHEQLMRTLLHAAAGATFAKKEKMETDAGRLIELMVETG